MLTQDRYRPYQPSAISLIKQRKIVGMVRDAPMTRGLHETLRRAFLLMQAEYEKAAKQRVDSGGNDRGEFKKLVFSSPESRS